MGVFIDQVRIENYRSLKNVTLAFDEYTVLIGKNNCGKSNIIKALELAFTYSNVFVEDIYVSQEEAFDINKKIVIDIKVLPGSNNKSVDSAFDDSWGRRFGDAISSDETTDNEFFAFRTEITYDTDKELFVNSKYKIDKWNSDGSITIGSMIKRDALNGIDAISVQAQRDISLDIRDKKSVWGRLTSKIKVSEQIGAKIKGQLSKLNKEIVRQSDILKSISSELKNTTGERRSSVEISPLTRDIESLYKGMDIIYTDDKSTPTSVENLGLGIRSWAVFSTVKAEIHAKISKATKDEVAYHPVLFAEEPEAHVHPQAQRQLFSTLIQIPGQKVITTHSPYIVSQVDLDKIRYIKKENAYTEVVSLVVDDLTPDEIRKIKRTVMNTRGEILYANAIILVEGETEEQAVTRFLREYFNKEPFELGVNVVGVGGSNYSPFIKILTRIGIRWYIFSDGEANPLKKLKDNVKDALKLPAVDLSSFSNVFILENGHNFETYLMEQGYEKEIISAVNRVEKENGHDDDYFDYYIGLNHGQFDKPIKTGNNCAVCSQAILTGTRKNYDGPDGKKKALKDCITGKGGKTKYAYAIADEICMLKTKRRRIPLKLKLLFEKIECDINSEAGG